jgi:mRNA interferase HigB
MRIISRKTLKVYWEKHKEIEEQLASWYAEAHKSKWKTPKEIKVEYPKASIIGDNRVVFNICGNKYRLVVKVNYQRGWVFIKFIGTHQEYNKINAETI